jgi:hypothetical protein
MNYTKGNWTIHDTNKYETPHIECGIYRICRIADNREYKANASLIAAAPDMYEALQSVLLRLDMEAKEKGEDAIFPCAAMRSTIRQALNKATGGTK